MAEMEFGRKFAETTGQVATTAVVEGGGVALGFLGAGATGKYFENTFKKGVTRTSPLSDKIVAWAANVTPKVGVWYLLKKIGPKDPRVVKDLGELAIVDAKKASVASIVVDGLMRVSNGGAPGAGFKLFGIDMLTGESGNGNVQQVQQMQGNIQRVIQENSALRGQLNQALQRLATAPAIPAAPAPVITVTQMPPDHDRAYGMMQTTPEAENRRKAYQAMDPFVSPDGTPRRKEFGTMESVPPAISERNRQFGAMNKADFNFAGESEGVAAAFGML